MPGVPEPNDQLSQQCGSTHEKGWTATSDVPTPTILEQLIALPLATGFPCLEDIYMHFTFRPLQVFLLSQHSSDSQPWPLNKETV